MAISFEFPPIFALNQQDNRNTIQQLLLPGAIESVNIKPYSDDPQKGYIITTIDNHPDQILITTVKSKLPDKFTKVIWIKSYEVLNNNAVSAASSHAKWVKHPLFAKKPKEPINFKQQANNILKSWQNSFKYLEENPIKKSKGLRPPQIGAVHAIHAHWAITDRIATIVMPTGTGKTETMLSLYVSKRCEKLLVVVPTDALRTQIGNKFLTLGILKEIKVLDRKSEYPIVGFLRHRPQNIKTVDSIFEKCNVIVTTMSIVGQCSEIVQKRISYHCPYLFIDEAHHIAAKTWKRFLEKFK